MSRRHVPALQPGRMSRERMIAELRWADLTRTGSRLPAMPASWSTPGRGRHKGRHVVIVERKTSHRMMLMPDGRRIAGSRRIVRTTITV